MWRLWGPLSSSCSNGVDLLVLQLFFKSACWQYRTSDHSGDFQVRPFAWCTGFTVRYRKSGAKLLRRVVKKWTCRGQRVIPVADLFGQCSQSLWIIQDYHEDTYGSSNCQSIFPSCGRSWLILIERLAQLCLVWFFPRVPFKPTRLKRLRKWNIKKLTNVPWPRSRICCGC